MLPAVVAALALTPHLSLATGRAWIQARLDAAVARSTVATSWRILRCTRVDAAAVSCTTERTVISGGSCDIVVTGRLGAGGSFAVRRARAYDCRPR